MWPNRPAHGPAGPGQRPQPDPPSLSSHPLSLSLVHFPSHAWSHFPLSACDAVVAAWCPGQRRPRLPLLLAGEAPARSPPPYPLHEDPRTRPHMQLRETLAPMAWDRQRGSQHPRAPARSGHLVLPGDAVGVVGW
jgi:hypothetical protein